jgi:hypothetical protein
MIRVFVDTNVYVSALVFGGTPGGASVPKALGRSLLGGASASSPREPGPGRRPRSQLRPGGAGPGHCHRGPRSFGASSVSRRGNTGSCRLPGEAILGKTSVMWGGLSSLPADLLVGFPKRPARTAGRQARMLTLPPRGFPGGSTPGPGRGAGAATSSLRKRCPGFRVLDTTAASQHRSCPTG